MSDFEECRVVDVILENLTASTNERAIFQAEDLGMIFAATVNTVKMMISDFQGSQFCSFSALSCPIANCSFDVLRMIIQKGLEDDGLAFARHCAPISRAFFLALRSVASVSV